MPLSQRILLIAGSFLTLRYFIGGIRKNRLKIDHSIFGWCLDWRCWCWPVSPELFLALRKAWVPVAVQFGLLNCDVPAGGQAVHHNGSPVKAQRAGHLPDPGAGPLSSGNRKAAEREVPEGTEGSGSGLSREKYKSW